MLKNYLTVAVRNLLRHKTYSLINIAGLSVGMVCTIIILLWVQYELSFDRYHENADRIYRLGADMEIGETRRRYAVSSLPIGPTLQRDYPEVLRAVKFYTYLLLRSKQDAMQLEQKFPALIQAHMGEILEALGGRIEYFLQP